MSWDDRQRALLEAMGYRVFSVAPGAEPSAAVPTGVEPPPAEPARPAVLQAPAVRPTTRAELEGLDLDALRQATAACTACPLGAQRRNAVFGSGSTTPQWLVLTEPPDEAADASGEVLPGPAGKLLDHMLTAAGLSRDAVFVTPVLKCRPPRGRPAEAAELQACSGILGRQIALLQPRLVLAMGRQSAQSLTGRADPIGKLRGAAHHAFERPLVATYDPAYLLRAPADKAGAWDDLCLAREAEVS